MDPARKVVESKARSASQRSTASGLDLSRRRCAGKLSNSAPGGWSGPWRQVGISFFFFFL